jgi:hypothetical protein
VTATAADNITASLDQSFFNEYQDWLQRPWQDYFEFRGMPSYAISYYESKLKNHQNSITTVLEARWWFYYTMRHQWWTVGDWNLNLENGPGHNVTSFFDSYDFDAWSQVNRNQFIPDNQWTQYKQCFKDEIYKLWPDQEYCTNKTKANSVMMIAWHRRKAMQNDQQYLFIYMDQNGQPQTFRQKYWPFVDKIRLLEELNEIR